MCNILNSINVYWINTSTNIFINYSSSPSSALDFGSCSDTVRGFYSHLLPLLAFLYSQSSPKALFCILLLPVPGLSFLLPRSSWVLKRV